MPNNKVSPDRFNILADAAEMYYLKGQSQSQIAKNLDVSRSMVSRMLTDARRLGLVKFHIERPVNHDIELEKLLCQQFGLKKAIVVVQPSDQALLPSLGKAAARYIEEQLMPGQTIGISWGTTISATVDELQFETPVPGIRIVQLLGSLGVRTEHFHSISIVNRLVGKLGGEAIYLNAPFLVETTQLASVLKESKDILETFQIGSHAAVALLGIGSVDPKSTPYVISGYVPENEMQEICDIGAVGDVCGIFVDIFGNPLHSDLQDRTIGMPLEDIRNIPLRIGISGGPRKIKPIIGVLRGQHVNVLVTDALTAQGVLTHAND